MQVRAGAVRDAGAIVRGLTLLQRDDVVDLGRRLSGVVGGVEEDGGVGGGVS